MCIKPRRAQTFSYAAAGIFLLICSSGSLATDVPIREQSPEIVVTATKKAKGEKLQDAPAAVNAFGEAEIDARKLRDLQGLTYAVPGVSLDSVGTFRGTANFAIRGLGINSSIASVDPAVGTFVDGVYLGTNAGVLFDLFDIDRIEILRGPQGTLYGRNTTGGAVLVETADPTHRWEAKALGALEGPVDLRRGGPSFIIQSALSGPLTPALAFRFGASYKGDAGYFRNRLDGEDVGEARTALLRGGLSYEAGPIRVVAKGEYLDVGGDGAISQNHGLFDRNTFDVSLDNDGNIDARSLFATLRADYALAGGSITNVAGYRKYDQLTDNDIDSTPAFLFHSKTGLRQEQISNELRYSGQLGMLDMTLGTYLFQQRIAYQEDRVFPVAVPQFGGGRQFHRVYGLFGQGEYALSGPLSLIAGLRWSLEEKSAAVTYVRPRSPCSVIEKSCPTTGNNPFFPAERNGFDERRSWANLAPKLGLQYAFSGASNFYGSWTRGYRSGGFNVRVTQPLSFEALAADLGTHAYEDERADTYELGAKLSGSGGRSSLNLAVYRSEVRDLQREVNVASASAGLAQSIFNTADARILGGEAEASVALRNTRLSANFGYIDARYRQVRFDISGDGKVDAADLLLRLPRVPKWTFGGEIRHRWTLPHSSLLEMRASFQHRDAYAWTDSNFGWISSSDNLDADLTWSLSPRRVRLSLYGRNLLDQIQFGGDTQLGFAGGPLSDGNNRPFDPRPFAGTFSPIARGRVIGIQAAYSY